MPEQHITVQEYQFHAVFSEFPNGEDVSLCGGKASHFIAGLLFFAAFLAVMTCGTAHLMGGADAEVYRRHAEIRAGV